ncbi:hypothetical protein BCR36DRAFT_585504 [Piromyces finnis]|uniref:Chitinase n=1 Tax=Piromyces finnis TaxID=1754191 RepID=A0A1Y1V3K1_9FUNG|nr:hypothetical protein BCR36DRAFT_585504 [Piromyces finnis]|eukprot:ORX45740.1 hypothetical protein BCR36DRAFT_585504 [Piromyces finnis]
MKLNFINKTKVQFFFNFVIISCFHNYKVFGLYSLTFSTPRVITITKTLPSKTIILPKISSIPTITTASHASLSNNNNIYDDYTINIQEYTLPYMNDMIIGNKIKSNDALDNTNAVSNKESNNNTITQLFNTVSNKESNNNTITQLFNTVSNKESNNNTITQLFNVVSNNKSGKVIKENTKTKLFNIINDDKSKKKKNDNILFAPYVDITLYPTFDLVEAKRTLGIDTVIISFIVSCVISTCTINNASFGGTIGINDTDVTGTLTSIDDSINKFRKEGGRIIISFGGAYNDELALHHDNAETLAKEYQKVIEKYQPIRIDFDMEGTSLMDDVVNGRKIEEVHKLRAKALNIVRRELKDKMVSISLCLPVNPDFGFDNKALTIIEIMKNENVPIDVISIMAMDYGTNYISNGFYNNTIQSLEKSYKQSRFFYSEIKMGVIPMIGQNDDGSILSLSETEKLVNYLKTKEYVSMISMWSINRDKNDGMFTSLIKNTFKYPMESIESNKSTFQYTPILKKFIN